jgi:N-acetylglucosamine-6-phosphate deacetylase
MARSVRNAARELRIPLEDALRFASTEPAEFLGLGNELGRLAPGYRADVVAFKTPEIHVIETWVAGRPTHSALAAARLTADY